MIGMKTHQARLLIRKSGNEIDVGFLHGQSDGGRLVSAQDELLADAVDELIGDSPSVIHLANRA